MKTLKDLYCYREMIISLVRKGLRGRYKRSFLGFLWTFINPLLQLIIYTFVFSQIMKVNVDKFYLFLFVALIPWLFFSASLTGGAIAIISEENLVKKVYFPRQILPISYVTTAFVNMLLCFIVIFAVLFFVGVGVNPYALLFLPIIMLVEYILCLGIAMLTSALTVYFRDLEHILSIVSMAWMYLTPVMYSVDMVPKDILPYFSFNPMSPIIIAYRDILYYKQIPQMSTLLQALIIGVGFLLFGNLVFAKLQKHFAEEF